MANQNNPICTGRPERGGYPAIVHPPRIMAKTGLVRSGQTWRQIWICGGRAGCGRKTIIPPPEKIG